MTIARAAFFILLFLALPARAEWVSGAGERMFGPDLAENAACDFAERKARKDAIRKVTGETLSSEDLMVCRERKQHANCVLNQMTWSTIDGVIRRVRNLKRWTDSTPGRIKTCRVTLEAEVGVASGRPDPGFDVAVTLNRRTFRSGEKMVIRLTPTLPMSVSVFQWLPYEKGQKQVMRIFPNAFDRENLFSGAGTIPSEAGARRYDLAVAFPAKLDGKVKLVDEYLMVVGTRKSVTFRASYTLEEFNARLLEIPRPDRRDVRRTYNIVRP